MATNPAPGILDAFNASDERDELAERTAAAERAAWDARVQRLRTSSDAASHYKINWTAGKKPRPVSAVVNPIAQNYYRNWAVKWLALTDALRDGGWLPTFETLRAYLASKDGKKSDLKAFGVAALLLAGALELKKGREEDIKTLADALRRADRKEGLHETLGGKLGGLMRVMTAAGEQVAFCGRPDEWSALNGPTIAVGDEAGALRGELLQRLAALSLLMLLKDGGAKVDWQAEIEEAKDSWRRRIGYGTLPALPVVAAGPQAVDAIEAMLRHLNEVCPMGQGAKGVEDKTEASVATPPPMRPKSPSKSGATCSPIPGEGAVSPERFRGEKPYGDQLGFEHGGFVYRDAREKLNGKPLQVLEAFAQARNNALSASELRLQCWGANADVGDEAIRTHVSAARNALRQAIKKAKVKTRPKYNPLQDVNRGVGRTAWKLILP